MTGPTFIAEAGDDQFHHQFGGKAWNLVLPGSSSPSPATILTLDTFDERMEFNWPADRLPLASRLDAGIPERQSYIVEHDARRLVFDGGAWMVGGDEISVLPNPLPLRPLKLRPLTANESVVTAPSKYDVHDTFLSNKRSGFLRIGGEPLWLLDAETVECTCGRQTQFVACVGSEHYTQPSGIIAPGVPFFLGELALYFFACSTCSRVVALTQST